MITVEWLEYEIGKMENRLAVEQGKVIDAQRRLNRAQEEYCDALSEQTQTAALILGLRDHLAYEKTKAASE
jgi:hypothetical protein